MDKNWFGSWPFGAAAFNSWWFGGTGGGGPTWGGGANGHSSRSPAPMNDAMYWLF